MVPKQNTGVKKWHFLGLIFRWHSLSLLNPSSIWANITSVLRAKVQISSRYSNKVTNCWSPRHCFMRQQKLEPTFENPKGMPVNSWRPKDLALEAVYFMSSSSMANWRYPWARSNEVNQLLLWTTCKVSSICSNGKASLTMMEFDLQ